MSGNDSYPVMPLGQIIMFAHGNGWENIAIRRGVVSRVSPRGLSLLNLLIL